MTSLSPRFQINAAVGRQAPVEVVDPFRRDFHQRNLAPGDGTAHLVHRRQALLDQISHVIAQLVGRHGETKYVELALEQRQRGRARIDQGQVVEDLAADDFFMTNAGRHLLSSQLSVLSSQSKKSKSRKLKSQKSNVLSRLSVLTGRLKAEN